MYPYKLAGSLTSMDNHLKAIAQEETNMVSVSVEERLRQAQATRGSLAAQGLPVEAVDARIAELQAELRRQQENHQLEEEYEFALPVDGATEKGIQDRAKSEGPFVQPSAPGTYLGDITRLERDTISKPGILIIKVNWISRDVQEPACRGSLFCEMKDNAEWVLTRNVLGNLGIPYEVRGNRVLFNDFTRGGTEPFPAKAVWSRASQGRANFRIEAFQPANYVGAESAM